MRDVAAAADMVEVVSGRTQLRRASGSRFTGRCPFHEEKTPSFSVNPVDKLYYCFGCGKGGDVISFVRESENLDFVGAVEWLAERFRVTLEYEETSPHQDEARRRRERLYAVLEQTTGYFERLLWEGEGGASVRAYLAERGLGEEVSKEFRLGLAPGRGLAEKARETRLLGGRAAFRRPDDRPRRRLLPAPAHVSARRRPRPRGRVPGPQARRGRSAPGEVRQFARGRSLPQGLDPVRAPSRAHGDRETGPRGDRRGEHRRDRVAPGGLRAGRGLDGDGADRAPAAGARAADAEDLPLLRRGRGRSGRDAARDGARRRTGLRGEGRHAAARPGPRRCARGLRGAARRGGELPALPRAPGARALRRPAGGVRPGARGALEGRGLARAPGGAAPRRRPARPPEGDAWRYRARLRSRASQSGDPEAPDFSVWATGSSGRSSPHASPIPNNSQGSRSSRRSTSTPSSTAASRRCSSRRRRTRS